MAYVPHILPDGLNPLGKPTAASGADWRAVWYVVDQSHLQRVFSTAPARTIQVLVSDVPD
jgi:hypothetical protein